MNGGNGGNGGVEDGGAGAVAREEARAHFRRVLWRVMIVQVVTLALLGLMQARYHGG
ncbi:MAG TPA: hypothetical protein VK928_11850 [Longimicrobiales bacterium]|nr:hypothetical protein [Longimicrobiales bacterium]